MKNLEQRAEDLLAIAREYPPYGEDDYPPSWERRMKGAIAQVFFLGMGVGWDKCVASMEIAQVIVTIGGVRGRALTVNAHPEHRRAAYDAALDDLRNNSG